MRASHDVWSVVSKNTLPLEKISMPLTESSVLLRDDDMQYIYIQSVTKQSLTSSCVHSHTVSLKSEHGSIPAPLLWRLMSC